MASALGDPSLVDDGEVGPFTVRVGDAPAMQAGSAQKAAPVEQAVSQHKSRANAGWLVFVAAIILILGLTTAMMLVLTDVPLAAAFGVGLYCAFWLGGGFGTIFGSAVVFGNQH